MITHNPLHRSQRAGLPHWALASGDNAKSPQGIGMANAWRGQPAPDEPPHPLPGDPGGLATPPERTTPESPDLETKRVKRRAVHGHPVVPQMPLHDRAQPPAHYRDRCVQAPPKLGFDLAQLCLQPLPDRLPHHREPSIPLLPADVREAEEVERLRLPLPGAPPALSRIRAECQQARLLGVQLQLELREPLAQLCQEPLSVSPVLEPHDDVIRVPHDDHVAVGLRLPPPLSPEVEHVVQVHVGQEWRDAAPLGRAFLTLRPRPVLQHAGIAPFLDQPHDAPVRNPMLDELHQPPVVNGIEEPPDVGIEHPVHLPRQQSRIERIQRTVRAAPRPKPVGEAEEVRLVDGVQHLRRRALDDLVFQRGDAQRPQPPVGFGDVRPLDRLRSIRSALQPSGQVREVRLEGLPVVPPRLAVDARSRVPLQREVRCSQTFHVGDVVQERREPHRLVPLSNLTYPRQRTGRACPALRPGRGLPARVPFGQAPSLHPLRRRSPGLVRRLRRYYGPVRLPLTVHHRRTSMNFPMRPAAPSATGGQRPSRFSREVCLYMLGVSDRAEPRPVSRWRRTECGLPLLLTASALRSKVLSRLYTRPVRPPVNVSPPPLQAPTHDSGPVWVADPSPYDSFIRNTSPV